MTTTQSDQKEREKAFVYFLHEWEIIHVINKTSKTMSKYSMKGIIIYLSMSEFKHAYMIMNPSKHILITLL